MSVRRDLETFDDFARSRIPPPSFTLGRLRLVPDSRTARQSRFRSSGRVRRSNTVVSRVPCGPSDAQNARSECVPLPTTSCCPFCPRIEESHPSPSPLGDRTSAQEVVGVRCTRYGDVGEKDAVCRDDDSGRTRHNINIHQLRLIPTFRHGPLVIILSFLLLPELLQIRLVSKEFQECVASVFSVVPSRKRLTIEELLWINRGVRGWRRSPQFRPRNSDSCDKYLRGAIPRIPATLASEIDDCPLLVFLRRNCSIDLVLTPFFDEYAPCGADVVEGKEFEALQDRMNVHSCFEMACYTTRPTTARDAVFMRWNLTMDADTQSSEDFDFDLVCFGIAQTSWYFSPKLDGTCFQNHSAIRILSVWKELMEFGALTEDAGIEELSPAISRLWWENHLIPTLPMKNLLDLLFCELWESTDRIMEILRVIVPLTPLKPAPSDRTFIEQLFENFVRRGRATPTVFLLEKRPRLLPHFGTVIAIVNDKSSQETAIQILHSLNPSLFRPNDWFCLLKLFYQAKNPVLFEYVASQLAEEPTRKWLCLQQLARLVVQLGDLPFLRFLEEEMPEIVTSLLVQEHKCTNPRSFASYVAVEAEIVIGMAPFRPNCLTMEAQFLIEAAKAYESIVLEQGKPDFNPFVRAHQKICGLKREFKAIRHILFDLEKYEQAMRRIYTAGLADTLLPAEVVAFAAANGEEDFLRSLLTRLPRIFRRLIDHELRGRLCGPGGHQRFDVPPPLRHFVGHIPLLIACHGLREEKRRSGAYLRIIEMLLPSYPLRIVGSEQSRNAWWSLSSRPCLFDGIFLHRGELLRRSESNPARGRRGTSTLSTAIDFAVEAGMRRCEISFVLNGKKVTAWNQSSD